MCNCGPEVTIGGHENCVTVQLPPHMQSTRMAREKAGLSPDISLDRCLVGKVKELWQLEIITLNSCCGHNVLPPTILVAEDDIQYMRDLGYYNWHHKLNGVIRADCFVVEVDSPSL